MPRAAQELFYGVYRRDADRCLDALITMGVLVSSFPGGRGSFAPVTRGMARGWELGCAHGIPCPKGHVPAGLSSLTTELLPLWAAMRTASSLLLHWPLNRRLGGGVEMLVRSRAGP